MEAPRMVAAMAATEPEVNYFWIGFVDVNPRGGGTEKPHIAHGPHLMRVSRNEVHCVTVDLGVTEKDPVTKKIKKIFPDSPETELKDRLRVSLGDLGLDTDTQFYAWYPFGYWSMVAKEFSADDDGNPLRSLSLYHLESVASPEKGKKTKESAASSIAVRCIRCKWGVRIVVGGRQYTHSSFEVWRLYELPKGKSSTFPVLVYCLSLEDFKRGITKLELTGVEMDNSPRWLNSVATQTHFFKGKSQDFIGVDFQTRNVKLLRTLLETLTMATRNNVRGFSEETRVDAAGKSKKKNIWRLVKWNTISPYGEIDLSQRNVAGRPEWKDLRGDFEELLQQAIDASMANGAGPALSLEMTFISLGKILEPSFNSISDQFAKNDQAIDHMLALLGVFPPETRIERNGIFGTDSLVKGSSVFAGTIENQYTDFIEKQYTDARAYYFPDLPRSKIEAL
jgi:hypothetical protein